MPSRPFSGHQLVDGPQEGCQGFPASRGGGDEKMLPPSDLGPCLLLYIGWPTDPFLKPLGDEGVELRKSTVFGTHFMLSRNPEWEYGHPPTWDKGKVDPI